MDGEISIDTLIPLPRSSLAPDQMARGPNRAPFLPQPALAGLFNPTAGSHCHTPMQCCQEFAGGMKPEQSVATRFAVGRVKIHNAMLGRKTAVGFYRISAAEYLLAGHALNSCGVGDEH